MDQLYRLYLFILSTTILFTDIRSTPGICSRNWFEAQHHCLDHGLTIEKNKSHQPYWTGVYRRLTPWINILGCYPDSIATRPDVIKKTMIISSVGMCQELCYHEKSYMIALKMNICLCIESNVDLNPFNELPPSDCNFTCEDNTDDIYLKDCGGENAYNLFEVQKGTLFKLNPEEKCLSLQCSEKDTRFIPQICSAALNRVCQNKIKPDNGFDTTWSLSMEQCKISHQPHYLFGDVALNDPDDACNISQHQFQIAWIGVAQQVYTSIDQGCEISEEQRETFLECQMCTEKNCRFMACSDFLDSSIYCKSISDTSHCQITEHLTTSQGGFSASTSMSNHLTSEEVFVSTSTTGYYDSHQSPSTDDKEQMSSASDELALKISLPVVIVFILLLCAIAVVFYSRRRKMIKADKTTKAQKQSGTGINVDSNVDSVQNNSYFVLEQCPQYISKGSDSSNESPYNNSAEGVYDHLRDKISRKPELEDTYQHASVGVSRDTSEYDTMANTVNKKQGECDSYDYSHQDSNGIYACDLRAKNNLTDNPYDVAV